jgi:hypothetical protein
MARFPAPVLSGGGSFRDESPPPPNLGFQGDSGHNSKLLSRERQIQPPSDGIGNNLNS